MRQNQFLCVFCVGYTISVVNSNMPAARFFPTLPRSTSLSLALFLSRDVRHYSSVLVSNAQ